MPRGRNRETHRCSVCGKVGHSLETCTLPGAALVRSLKRRNLVLQKQSSKPHSETRTSQTSLSGRNHKAVQRKVYSGRPSKRKGPARRVLHELLDRSPAASNAAAVDWLLKHRVVQVPPACEGCGCTGTVQGPFELCRKGRQPFWHFRCGDWRCQKRHTFLTESAFAGLQAPLPKPHGIQGSGFAVLHERAHIAGDTDRACGHDPHVLFGCEDEPCSARGSCSKLPPKLQALPSLCGHTLGARGAPRPTGVPAATSPRLCGG